jgi:hypothetical protein
MLLNFAIDWLAVNVLAWNVGPETAKSWQISLVLVFIYIGQCQNSRCTSRKDEINFFHVFPHSLFTNHPSFDPIWSEELTDPLNNVHKMIIRAYCW